MSDSFEQLGEQLLATIKTHADEIGIELKGDLQGVSLFASERAAHLASIVGQPGYTEALEAERDALALRVTNDAIERADELDQRFQTFISQVLGVAAQALAIAIPA